MKPIKHFLLPMLAAVTLVGSAQAQGPGGFGRPGGGGGFQPPPAMMAKLQAWRQWSDTHKNVGALQRTLGAMARLEQNPQTKLTKPQAHAALAVINKWKVKPALNDAQAGVVNAQLSAVLNPVQMKAIASAPQGRGRGGPGGGFGGGRGPGAGPGFGGGGRPGGPGGAPGAGPRFDPVSFPSPREYNPLNPATNPMARSRGRAGQRLAELMSALATTK